MPIFESLRQRESLPCSYPLAMGPSRQINTFWVNCRKKRKNCTLAFFQFFFYVLFILVLLGGGGVSRQCYNFSVVGIYYIVIGYSYGETN